MGRRYLTQKSLQSELTDNFADSAGLTFYASPDIFPSAVDKLLDKIPFPEASRHVKELLSNESVIREAQRYRTGAAVFHGNGDYIVMPPYPVLSSKIVLGEWDTSPLFGVWEQKHDIGVVLITWGSYGIGVFSNGKRIASKVGTGHIHQKQKQGGSSQARFSRRTDNQRRDFLRRVVAHAEEIFRQHNLDYIYFGGNRLILKPFLEESRYLSSLAGIISGRIFDVHNANQQALEHCLYEINKAAVFTFGDEKSVPID